MLIIVNILLIHHPILKAFVLFHMQCEDHKAKFVVVNLVTSIGSDQSTA